MDNGLGGSFRKLLAAVEGAMNAIGKALEGTLKPFVDNHKLYTFFLKIAISVF